MYKSLIIAFSMYSKIPMPCLPWDEKNIKYVFVFFPWIGLIIGALVWFVYFLNIPYMLKYGVLTFLPIAVTGGIHIEGFMDVADAKNSFGDKEKKIAILKDPHCGAFAVIWCVSYMLLNFVMWSTVSKKGVYVIALGYILSRTLSAVSLLKLNLLQNKGIAYTFVTSSSKIAVWVLCFYILLCGVLMILFGGICGCLALCGCVLACVYHYYNYKQFGGLNGDLAGFFLQICELFILAGCCVGGLL